MRGNIVELTKQGCCSETQSKLWESLFSNPADWLDYRQSKRSPAYPDFRHRSTKQPLWLNSPRKPAWVDFTLIRSDYLHELDASLLAHLSQCGSLECALHTLLALPSPQGVLSWRSIFSGFVGHGRSYEALRMHSYMRESGFEPDRYVFVILLKACASRKDCEEGRKLHSDSVERWLALDVYMGSSLVNMYGKCGHVAESEMVFCDLRSRNAVTWNAMLSVYVEHAHGVKALLLYRQMQEEGAKANDLTYVAMLQACSILSLGDGCDQRMLLVHGEEEEEVCLCIGRAMHSDARKQRLDSHPHVGNTLVAMYGKFGKLGEAENVFSALSHSDAITWNVIVLAHVEHGRAQNALKLHKLMFEEGVSPDAHTFAISLQACGNLVDDEDAATDARAIAGDIGLALHADVERKGFEDDSFIVSALVSLYGKCGMAEEAEIVLRESANVDDVVAWSTLLSAYVERGLGRKALLAYRQMQEEGVEIDEHALVVALQACGTLLQTPECMFDAQEEFLTSTTVGDIGHALHGEARRKGYTFHPHVHNSLISMYGKCGKLMEAQQVFSEFPPRNVVSWNVMLSAFVEQGQIVEALQLYKHVLLENVVPDNLTYLIMFQACGRFAEKDEVMVEGKAVQSAALLEIGQALHIDALQSGLILGAFVYNTLVNMYIKNGSLEKALKVVDDSPHHDCFPWNRVLSAFVEQGRAEEALQVYEKMHKNSTPFSPSSIVSCLQACGESSCLRICRQLHAGIVLAGDEASLTVANTLIHAYGSCGSMEDGQEAFNGLLCPDLVSWNAYISGHARQGKNVQCCLEKMRETGIDPNRVTFLSLISACSHGGDIYRGLEYLECMLWGHSMNPDRNHLAAMVDLLGRAGSFKHVEDLLGMIRASADLSIWLRLLGPCYTHSNAELGRWAFDHAVQLHPDRTTLYVWMSNIYAAIAAADGECELKRLRMDDAATLDLAGDVVPPGQCLYHLLCQTAEISCIHRNRTLKDVVTLQLEPK